jgi:NADH-quinone oxidoreductase subunit N
MVDLTSSGINFSLVWPEVVLIAFASVILLFSSFRPMTRLAPVLAISGVVLALVATWAQWGLHGTGFFGMVLSDSFGISFRVLFLITAILTIFLSHRYLELKGLDKPEFYGLLLIATAGMMVMANSADLVIIFLGLEIMSVPLYVLAGFARRNLESNEAGLKYFIMGAFASGFLLMGIAFIFGASGTTDLRAIVSDFATILSQSRIYMMTGIVLTLVGFGFKIAMVPFHSWVPDVYQGAPTPVTAFFSVGPKAAGFAALLRIYSFGFGDMPQLSTVFWVLAVLTMTVGNILALRQDNLKRLLAYSSIAHAGYILVAFVPGNGEAVSAAMFYLVAYMLFNLGAFAVVILLESRSGAQTDITELHGMAQAHPYLAAALALFMFALAGFPPTIGFFGKFYLFSTAVKAGYIWLTVIGVLNSFLSVYYYLRIIKACYFEKHEGVYSRVSYNPAMIAVLIITVLGTLGLGFFPSGLLDFSRSALFAFL